MQNYVLFLFLVFSVTRTNAQVFYECRSTNGDTTFYLMGTLHYLPNRVKLDTLLLGNYIKKCEVVFSEIYIDDGDSGYKTALSNVESIKRYKNNGLLKDRVTKKEYRTIFNYYHRRFGISKRSFKWASCFNPWVMDSRLRYNGKKYYQMDNVLYSIAIGKGKIVKNLDNEDLLFAACSMFNSTFDIYWLLSKVNNENLVISHDEIIAQSYLEQDTLSIIKHLNVNPEHLKYLIDDRNKHWVKVFEEQGGRTNFVYCGFAHLIAGQYALLKYFRSKHYSIKAIDFRLLGL